MQTITDQDPTVPALPGLNEVRTPLQIAIGTLDTATLEVMRNDLIAKLDGEFYADWFEQLIAVTAELSMRE